MTGPRVMPRLSVAEYRAETKARGRLRWEDLFAEQIRAAGLPTPLREHRFATCIGRQFRFDFAWPGQRLAVEVDGATWVGGRHNRGVGYEADCVKIAEAVLLGWRVLRFTSTMVDDGRALHYTTRALQDDRDAA